MQTQCSTCANPGTPRRFAPMCDDCYDRWNARTQRARQIIKSAGHANTDIGRALRVEV